jgi:hypothetical protein
MKPFGHACMHSEFWRFTRRSVPRGVAAAACRRRLPAIPGVQIVGAALLSIRSAANIPIAAAMTFLTNRRPRPLIVLALKIRQLPGFPADIESFYALIRPRRRRRELGALAVF